MINRREMNAGMGALGAAAFLPAAALAEDMSLAQAAGAGGLEFGAAVRLDQLTGEAGYRDLLLAQCSQFTPEIALKWAVIEPRRGALDFTQIDDVAAIATRQGKSLRGHTLLWDQSIPGWAQELLRQSADWSLITRYFASVIPRFGASIHVWDVVNEPIETGHRMDGLRDSIFR